MIPPSWIIEFHSSRHESAHPQYSLSLPVHFHGSLMSLEGPRPSPHPSAREEPVRLLTSTQHRGNDRFWLPTGHLTTSPRLKSAGGRLVTSTNEPPHGKTRIHFQPALVLRIDGVGPGSSGRLGEGEKRDPHPLPVPHPNRYPQPAGQ